MFSCSLGLTCHHHITAIVTPSSVTQMPPVRFPQVGARSTEGSRRMVMLTAPQPSSKEGQPRMSQLGSRGCICPRPHGEDRVEPVWSPEASKAMLEWSRCPCTCVCLGFQTLPCPWNTPAEETRAIWGRGRVRQEEAALGLFPLCAIPRGGGRGKERQAVFIEEGALGWASFPGWHPLSCPGCPAALLQEAPRTGEGSAAALLSHRGCCPLELGVGLAWQPQPSSHQAAGPTRALVLRIARQAPRPCLPLRS